MNKNILFVAFVFFIISSTYCLSFSDKPIKNQSDVETKVKKNNNISERSEKVFKKKYYWCEKQDYPSRGLSMMIPVEVEEGISKVEFMKSIKVNGVDEQSSQNRHVFKMTPDWRDFYKSSKGYPFRGKWGKGGPIQGVIYNEHYSGGPYLVYTIDRVGTFEYPCQRLQ